MLGVAAHVAAAREVGQSVNQVVGLEAGHENACGMRCIELLCNHCAVREILCEQVRLNRKDAKSAKVLMFSQPLVAD
jgi:hypothetical protein